MTTQLSETLIKENISKDDRIYRSSLNELKKILNIDVYDKANPPKKYHDNRLTAERLEEIAKDKFSGIDFVCDTCADSGILINFKPKSNDDASQKYFGHQICIGENSALKITLQMSKKSKILPSTQRVQYLGFINSVVEEYLENGKENKRYVPSKT